MASVVSSTLGFGGALIMIPLISGIVGIQTAIALVAFWGIFEDTLKFIRYRKYLDWKFLKPNIIGGIPGIILGSLLIVVAPINWISLFLGIFILTYVTIEINKERKKIEDKGFLKTPIIVGGGFAYGFLGGLIGASGPINVALLQKTGHSRENFIGNFGAAAIACSIFRLGIYLQNGLFPIELWLVFILGFVSIFLGFRIGFYLTPKIPVHVFQKIIFILLIIIGIKLVIGFFY